MRMATTHHAQWLLLCVSSASMATATALTAPTMAARVGLSSFCAHAQPSGRVRNRHAERISRRCCRGCCGHAQRGAFGSMAMDFVQRTQGVVIGMRVNERCCVQCCSTFAHVRRSVVMKSEPDTTADSGRHTHPPSKYLSITCQTEIKSPQQMDDVARRGSGRADTLSARSRRRRSGKQSATGAVRIEPFSINSCPGLCSRGGDVLNSSEAVQVPGSSAVADELDSLNNSESLPNKSLSNDLHESNTFDCGHNSFDLDRNDRLRIVVVSDTHGFESDFDGGLGVLPHGDVLVHCGDWHTHWPETGVSPAAAFDKWLSRQSHPLKLVVRGNHDPRNVAFPTSGAVYCANSSTCLTHEASGVRFGLVSFSRKPVPFVPACDVLVTHVPPLRVRDACMRGTHVGCPTLRYAVEVAHAKPRLWLCGHIHEAAGAERVRFSPPKGAKRGRFSVTAGSATDTVVVNAANANDGMAAKVVRGPYVIDFVK